MVSDLQAAILFSPLPWRTPRPPACLLPWETQCTAAPTPRPAALRLLTGVSPGRDSGGRLVPTPPAFERSAPEPPDWLSPEALAEWRRIVPALDALGVLKEPDRAMVSTYCETWSTYVMAIRQVRAEGVTVLNPQTGCRRKNPALSAAETAGAQLLASCREFGLTPSSEQPWLRRPPTTTVTTRSPGNPVRQAFSAYRSAKTVRATTDFAFTVSSILHVQLIFLLGQHLAKAGTHRR
jgi:P27 family predicted phage terminase small subunit